MRLPQLAQRLDEEQNWAQVLSGGEQQRVAFARALLYKPQWLFMDEATASLDDASETRLYNLLHERLPDTRIVSTGHHPNLAQFHARRLRLEDDPAGLGHLIPEELSERARSSILAKALKRNERHIGRMPEGWDRRSEFSVLQRGGSGSFIGFDY